MAQRVRAFRLAATLLLALHSKEAMAQPAASAPPAVGVVRAERQQITETDEFIGRIQAVNRVALVARVTGFLEKRFFDEGAEVKKGDRYTRSKSRPFRQRSMPRNPPWNKWRRSIATRC